MGLHQSLLQTTTWIIIIIIIIIIIKNVSTGQKLQLI